MSMRVKKRPVLELRGLKWLLRRDRFAVHKFKWEDPSATSTSPHVLKRTAGMGGISIGIRYEQQDE